MDSSYQLIFSGRVLTGFDAQAVRAQLGQRLKLDEARLARLFSGAPVVIKRGLDGEQAQRWVTQFAALGAGLAMQASPDTVPALPPAPPAPAAEPAEAAALALVPLAAPAVVPDTPSVDDDRDKAQTDRAPAVDAAMAPSRRSGHAPSGPAPLNFRTWASEDEPSLFGTSFEGRMGRLRANTCGTWLLNGLVAVALLGVVAGKFWLLLFLPAAVAVIFWSVRLSVLRLHDLNLSGWFTLISLIPVLGTILGLVLMVWPGSTEDNQFGEVPQAGSVAGLIVASAVLLGLVSGLLWHSLRLIVPLFSR
jgi:uncharacterized membrane protein YhaH (DUF805 family)